MRTVRIDVIISPDGRGTILDAVPIDAPTPATERIPAGSPALTIYSADGTEVYRTALSDLTIGPETFGDDGSLARTPIPGEKIVSVEAPFPGEGATIILDSGGTTKAFHRFRLALPTPSLQGRPQRRTQFRMKADDRWGINNPNAITLAFMAEAFMSAQHDQFDAVVDSCLNRFEQIEAFQPVLSALRVMRIYVPSVEDRLGGETYFSARFQETEPTRVLRIDEKRARQTLNDYIRSSALGIVLVNTTDFGGAGGSTAVVSAHPVWAPDILAHELGHSLFGLADEYATAGQKGKHDAIEPNVSRSWQREDLKWADLIPVHTPYPVWGFEGTGSPPEGIGAFQGAKYSADYWRPSYNCKMRKLETPQFCPVCTRQIRKRLGRRLASPSPELV